MKKEKKMIEKININAKNDYIFTIMDLSKFIYNEVKICPALLRKNKLDKSYIIAISNDKTNIYYIKEYLILPTHEYNDIIEHCYWIKTKNPLKLLKEIEDFMQNHIMTKQQKSVYDSTGNKRINLKLLSKTFKSTDKNIYDKTIEFICSKYSFISSKKLAISFKKYSSYGSIIHKYRLYFDYLPIENFSIDGILYKNINDNKYYFFHTSYVDKKVYKFIIDDIKKFKKCITDSMFSDLTDKQLNNIKKFEKYLDKLK